MKLKGVIRWFDGMSGEGMVRGENLQSYYIHFTAIDGISRHNHHWPTELDQSRLKTIDGAKCEFELINDTTFVQVSNCKIEGLS